MIEPREMTYEQFPHSEQFSKGIEVLKADFSKRHVTMTNIVYAVKDSIPLHMNVIVPELRPREDKLPLICYSQGSAWGKQNLGNELSQLADFARRGFVIAVIEYRPSSAAIFPAQIVDTKTAVRYMIEHAQEYSADPENLYMWGDSSGGHTTLMVALSDFQEKEEVRPIRIKALVDYYGPTDVSKMNDEPSVMDHIGSDSPEGRLLGGVSLLDHPEKVALANPMSYITPEKVIPPLLIVHGSKDRLVPFGQSVMLYERMKACGKPVRCIQLKGADHGGAPFWTDQILGIVEDFLRASAAGD